MLNRSASLALSTSVLKALPGKLDIKRHSPYISKDFPLHTDTISRDCPLCISLGHTSKFLNFNIFLSPKTVSILVYNEDLDEMPHYAAFHLGLHCLPKYLFIGIQNEKVYAPRTYSIHSIAILNYIHFS